MEKEKDISAVAYEHLRTLNVRFMLHTTQVSSLALEILESGLMALPSTRTSEAENIVIAPGSDMAVYLYSLVYDQIPTKYWSQYDDAPTEVKEELKNVYRARCNAKQFGVHNMLKEASHNFMKILKDIDERLKQTRESSQRITAQYQLQTQLRLYDGQGAKAAELRNNPPVLTDEFPTTTHVSDKDYVPAELNVVVSE